MTTALASKDTEQNNVMDTQRLLLANGALANFGLENNKPVEGNLALLPSSSPPDQNVADLKVAGCILFSNKLTETVLGEVSLPDREVERMNLSNKAADMDAETEATESCHLDKTVSPPAETLASTKTSSRGRCLCLKSREEFGFLLIPDFLILSVSFLFLAYGCSAPVVYLVPYALSVGLEHQRAAFLMSLFGVSSIVGNITFGWITDRKCLRSYRMLSYMLAIAMEGLCCMFVYLLHSFTLLVPFSLLYGYFDGAYVALIPVVTSDVVGSTYLTSALGVVYFLHAIPYLISPPIGGWLVDETGDYAATFFLSGASFMFCSVVLTAAMLVRRCQRSEADSAAGLNPDGTAAAAQRGVV